MLHPEDDLPRFLKAPTQCSSYKYQSWQCLIAAGSPPNTRCLSCPSSADCSLTTADYHSSRQNDFESDAARPIARSSLPLSRQAVVAPTKCDNCESTKSTCYLRPESLQCLNCPPDTECSHIGTFDKSLEELVDKVKGIYHERGKELPSGL